jgi:hypothetical protein
LNRSPVELFEINASHQAFVINGFEFDDENNLIVSVDIGEELIGSEINIMLIYQDDYITEWFALVLSESSPQPIISDVSPSEITPDTAGIYITGENFGEQGDNSTVIIQEAGDAQTEVDIVINNWSDTYINNLSCYFVPFEPGTPLIYMLSMQTTIIRTLFIYTSINIWNKTIIQLLN